MTKPLLKKLILTGFSVLFLFGCTQKVPPIFELLEPSETGIDFNNLIEETDSFNILTSQYIYNGGGVAITDFNNDSLPDIFFTGNVVSNRLYLNKGGFKFRDVTEQAGISGGDKWCSGVSVVDINNDGMMDVYITATFSPEPTERENIFYINQGLDEDGVPVFKDEAGKYGVADNGHSTHAAFFDYDLDGDLDLYVLTNVLVTRSYDQLYRKVIDGSSPTTDRLFRNNGNGSFTNVSDEAGILLEGYGLGIAVLDIDKNGYPDLYISNDFVTNDVLYYNNGDGTFTNKASEFFKHQSYASMGNDVGDINNDGLLEVMTLDMLPVKNERVKRMFSEADFEFQELMEKINYEQQYTRNCLQLNNGNGTFSDISQLTGMDETDWSWSVLFADYNNDGYNDVLITNGFPRDVTDNDFSDFRMSPSSILASEMDLLDQIPMVKIPNYIFRNKGNYEFENVTSQWGMDQPSYSNGAAFGDLDQDGDLDFVVNNINDAAFIYKNNSIETTENNYLRIKLKGPEANKPGIGARINIKAGDYTYYQENYPYRGYISSVEHMLHFGLGSTSIIDSLMIIWPDGKGQIITDVNANREIILDYKNAQENFRYPPQTKTSRLFTEITDSLNINFIHHDQKHIDFNIQRLLPKLYSQDGPGIAVGDVNGDGLDDFFIGNGHGAMGSLYKQGKNDTFTGKPLINVTSQQEDLGAIFFDADNDSDLDLYIVSGSSEYPPQSDYYQDRLYINDSQGNFTLDPSALPEINTPGSFVNAADFDKDGDLDLFVGGRIRQEIYPLPAKSYLLRNDGGAFTDVTGELAPEFEQLGMATTSLWTDFNDDGWIDIIVAGEWMPIMFFKNENGTFTDVTGEVGMIDSKGWWNSIISGDFDQDGDLDYIAGNQGLNNKHETSVEHPLMIYAKDFDQNGKMDPVMFAYKNGNYYPTHLRDDIGHELSYLNKRFPKFSDYGSATLEEIFTKEELHGVQKFQVQTFETSFIENTPEGFKMKALPVEAQFSPVYGMQTGDFDNDGSLDLLLVGNNYGTEVFTGRHDAFIGLFLKGNGDGTFTPLHVNKSGFFVDGDAKALSNVALAGGKTLFLASQNRSSIKAFTINKQQDRQFIKLDPLDYKAVIEYRDGRRETREFYYGSGYLSQNSRGFRVKKEDISSITIYNYLNEERVWGENFEL